MQYHCHLRDHGFSCCGTCDLKDEPVQAHTCDNILELPNYQESLLAMHKEACGSMTHELELELRSILDEKLKLALTCCNGYGLDHV